MTTLAVRNAALKTLMELVHEPKKSKRLHLLAEFKQHLLDYASASPFNIDVLEKIGYGQQFPQEGYSLFREIGFWVNCEKKYAISEIIYELSAESLSENLKEKFPELTEDDFEYMLHFIKFIFKLFEQEKKY